MGRRVAGVVAALVVAAGVGVGGASLADAAPAVPVRAGWLLLTVNGTTTALPPGQAVRAAIAVCGDRVEIPPTVAAVRGAFPGEVFVCEGVTLLAQLGPQPTVPPIFE
jgi:hypothetical protein